MIRVTFLGTSASRPTVGRNVSAVAVQREGVTLLFDCGEGTQRQMMRYGTGFAVDHIFITHLHADHYLGVIGLLRTLSLQARTEALHLYGPVGSRKVLETAIDLGGNRTTFQVDIRELSPGDSADWEDFAVEAVAVRHGVPAVGYALRERPRAGRFNVEAARALGIPEGPLFGRLHRGESIEWGGRSIDPAEVVGGARSGRLVVYTGDTRPADSIVDCARRADLLIHECTFGDEGVDRARETFHSTAREAAEIALRAGVKRLYLTHVSARYSANADPLLREAREVFRDVEVAYDGLTVEIEYPEDAQGGAQGNTTT